MLFTFENKRLHNPCTYLSCPYRIRSSLPRIDMSCVLALVLALVLVRTMSPVTTHNTVSFFVGSISVLVYRHPAEHIRLRTTGSGSTRRGGTRSGRSRCSTGGSLLSTTSSRSGAGCGSTTRRRGRTRSGLRGGTRRRTSGRRGGRRRTSRGASHGTRATARSGTRAGSRSRSARATMSAVSTSSHFVIH